MSTHIQKTTANASHQKITPYSPPTRGILSKLPPSWVPFAELARIDKPGGTIMVYLAFLIGLGYGACVFSPAVPHDTLAYTATILLAYCVFHRGGACIINDLLDCEYDRQVARCRNRPIARGAVTSEQALVWYSAHYIGTGICIAYLPSPMLALTYAVPIQTLASLYPLAKRYTDFPQLVLGLPMAGGIPMGAAAVGLNPFDTSSLAIFGATMSLIASNFIWTVIFDYISACRDTEDDIKAGVKGMAVRYQNTTAVITTLGIAQVACLTLTGILAHFSTIYYLSVPGVNAVCLAAIVKTVHRSRKDILDWWYAWSGLLVSGTTALGLFAEYYQSGW